MASTRWLHIKENKIGLDEACPSSSRGLSPQGQRLQETMENLQRTGELGCTYWGGCAVWISGPKCGRKRHRQTSNVLCAERARLEQKTCGTPSLCRKAGQPRVQGAGAEKCTEQFEVSIAIWLCAERHNTHLWIRTFYDCRGCVRNSYQNNANVRTVPQRAWTDCGSMRAACAPRDAQRS